MYSFRLVNSEENVKAGFSIKPQLTAARRKNCA